MPEQYIVYNADKKPRSPYTGQVCDPHQEANRSDRQTAETAVALGMAEGVGLVFTPGCGLVFIDLDHCLTPTGWSEQAVQVCQQFAGAYVEVSRSGTGLHLICAGSLPSGHRTRSEGLEVYSSGRYCALTGTGAQGDKQHNCQAALDQLYASRLVPVAGPVTDAEWTDGPCAEWDGPTDDLDLIVKMKSQAPSARSAFGGCATIAQLWEGDTSAYGDNGSSADQALCNHLAFWTGRDCERIDRLMRASGLCRGKWLEREDYRRRTILTAVGQCTAVYGTRGPDRREAEPPPPEPTGPGGWVTRGIMSATQQPEYFAGCVYVGDAHRILIPDGRMLKPEQFRVEYGGWSFVCTTEGKTTKSAWEAFTESQTYEHTKVASTVFRPELPALAVIEEEGWRVVNTYVPIQTTRQVGDATPFVDLLTKLLPDPTDREILTSYLAAMVQYPGRKFQWWPVLQGTEGNGKSAIIRAMTHAIGDRYTHLPNADAMAKTGNQFNGWVAGKLFIGIEEIYVPERRDFLEAFKTTVTNERVQMEGKGTNQTMGDNRANGIMCTNHKDGVPTTADTRRYAILYTAQQSKADKERDGMGGNYFPALYDWLRLEGYAIVNNYLREYAICAKFNPAGLCQEAPSTSSSAEAVRLSMGGIEQEVLEAVESGRPGFGGGWISSLALDKLLAERRMDSRLPRNKRRAVLQSLGYDYHPCLPDGYTNNAVAIDQGRPRLFIKVGHIHSNLQTCAEIVKHYQAAQSPPSWVAGRAVVSG